AFFVGAMAIDDLVKTTLDIAIYMFFFQHYKCSMLTVYDSSFPLHVDHPFPNQKVLVDEAKRSLFSG
ncbi:hypothetical protein Taro_012084, partial [Colocasia esculenta]|nr:hypothetical protein [Colocasia esculenta]